MRWVIQILACITTFFGFAQKPEVSLSTDFKSVQIGETVVLTVKSNMEGQVKIDFPDEFIAGYGSVNGMEQQMNYQTGKLSTIYYFSQNGAFKENGSFNFVAYVTNHRKVYKSNTITIRVEKKVEHQEEDLSQKTLRQPVFGVIQRSKIKLYEGEPIILESKVYSRVYLNFLEAYNSFEIDGKSESHDLDNAQVLYRDRESFKGQSFYTVTSGKKLVFVSSPGKYKIKPFEMILQYDGGGLFPERLSLTSLSSSFEVMPLPSGAPKSFIGAVGKYKLASVLNKTKVKSGDVVRLEIEVSGSGNLHNIDQPKLKLPKGIVIYGDPEIDEDFEFGLAGAEGKITYVYNLQLLSGGNFRLPPISIAYFDPEQKKYIQIRNSSFEIEVSGSSPSNIFVNQNSDTKEIEEQASLSFMEHPDVDQEFFYRSNWFWPTVLSPIFIAFLGGIFWVRKEDISHKVIEKSNRKKILANLFLRLEEIKQNTKDEKSAILALENLVRSFNLLFPSPKGLTCSKDELLVVMKENNLSEDLVEQTRKLLCRCEETRYSFLDEGPKLKVLTDEVESILKQLV